ncbi:hypothetical protein WJX79_006915 [Trebouxia sp. C0005]
MIKFQAIADMIGTREQVAELAAEEEREFKGLPATTGDETIADDTMPLDRFCTIASASAKSAGKLDSLAHRGNRLRYTVTEGTKQKNAARPLMVPPAAQRPKHMIGTASSAQAGVPSPCGTGSPPGASPGPTIAQKALLFGALPVM